MRPNWHHGQHPPACTCADCERNRRVGGGPTSALPPSPPGGRDEARIHRECEVYIARVCQRFGIRVPLFVLDDTMYNPGACGEAGNFVVRMQRHFTLTASRQDREAVIRHELAHISVHNTLGNVEAHGPEFRRELARLGGDRRSGRTATETNAGGGEDGGGAAGARLIGLVTLGLLAFVMLYDSLLPVLPGWSMQFLVPAADFVQAAYSRWPTWTILAGIGLGAVASAFLATSD